MQAAYRLHTSLAGPGVTTLLSVMSLLYDRVFCYYWMKRSCIEQHVLAIVCILYCISVVYIFVVFITCIYDVCTRDLLA